MALLASLGFVKFFLRDTAIIWVFPKCKNTVFHLSCSKKHPMNNIQWRDLLLFILSHFGDRLLQWVAFRIMHVEQHTLKSCQLYAFLQHVFLQCEVIHTEKSFFCYCEKWCYMHLLSKINTLTPRSEKKTRKVNFVSLCISKYYI